MNQRFVRRIMCRSFTMLSVERQCWITRQRLGQAVRVVGDGLLAWPVPRVRAHGAPDASAGSPASDTRTTLRPARERGRHLRVPRRALDRQCSRVPPGGMKSTKSDTDPTTARRSATRPAASAVSKNTRKPARERYAANVLHASDTGWVRAADEDVEVGDGGRRVLDTRGSYLLARLTPTVVTGWRAAARPRQPGRGPSAYHGTMRRILSAACSRCACSPRSGRPRRRRRAAAARQGVETLARRGAPAAPEGGRIDELRVLAPSQRRQFREDFWLARDPDPGTPDNELRTEYERRVATAEKRFRTTARRRGTTAAGRSSCSESRTGPETTTTSSTSPRPTRCARSRNRKGSPRSAGCTATTRSCPPPRKATRSASIRRARRWPAPRPSACCSGRRLVRAENPLAAIGRFRNDPRPRGVISCLVPPNSRPCGWRGMMNVSLKGAP